MREHVATMNRLIATLCVSLAAVAQSPRLVEAHRVLPLTDLRAGSAVTGDVNGDGKSDVVFGDYGAVWLGADDGSFTELPGALVDVGSVRTHLADLDADGDLDLISVVLALTIPGIGIFGGGIKVHLNDGSGRFTAQPFALGAGELSTSIASGDVDGDGDIDLLVGVRPTLIYTAPGGPWSSGTYSTTGGQDRLWLNQGNAQFVDGTSRLVSQADFTAEVALADFNGDGRLDIFAANHSVFVQTPGYPLPSSWSSGPQWHLVSRNQGNGTFAPAFWLPAGSAVTGLHVRDFDLDGDRDVLLRTDLLLQYLQNAGNATFQVSAPPLASVAATSLLVGDFDGDGLHDYGIRTTDNWWRPVRNLGGGSFLAQPGGDLFHGEHPDQQLFLADFERDGDLDLFATPDYGTRARVWRNDGTLPWRQPVPDLREERLVGALAITDYDSDGDLDLLMGPATLYPYPVGGRCYRNDGHGRFESVPAGDLTSTTLGYHLQMGCADLDGDGDVDCLAADQSGMALFRNDGGAFTRVAMGFPGSSVALGDLDNDGDIDALLCGIGSSGSSVLLNQGNATFTPHPTTLVLGVVQFVLADFDGDGDRDALAKGDSWQGLLFNNGSGGLTLDQSSGATGSGGGAAAADFDGDGDVDVLRGTQLWRNDGHGGFLASPSGLPLLPVNPEVVAADFDADGDIDLLRKSLVNLEGLADLFLNDGAGVFTYAGQPGPVNWERHAMTGDLDGDGDLDLVIQGRSQPRVYWNRRRQLSWSAMPRVAYPLALGLEAGASDPFILAFALGTARLPIPGFGLLRLDPASLAVAALGAVDATGRAGFQWAVPADPSLTGLAIHWQSLVGQPAALGNLETTTLLAR